MTTNILNNIGDYQAAAYTIAAQSTAYGIITEQAEQLDARLEALSRKAARNTKRTQDKADGHRATSDILRFCTQTEKTLNRLHSELIKRIVSLRLCVEADKIPT